MPLEDLLLGKDWCSIKQTIKIHPVRRVKIKSLILKLRTLMNSETDQDLKEILSRSIKELSVQLEKEDEVR
ncbi:MAG: hypothetical protein K0U78_15085 [Actinomycetia bacterium]|nr:hypothetical protein [Actinomycetes bacterium]